MRVLEAELKVGVSNHTSAFCHSVLRLEPYTACYFSCTYCYARWYREQGPPEPKPRLIKALRKLWSRLAASPELRLVPFRLSTLADPLQPAEAKEKLAFSILRLAGEFDVPVVLNTKSVLFTRGPWLSALEKLASEGLVLLQVSISALNPASRALEPKAPPPEERLEAISRVSDLAPCVLRLQPAIPGLLEVQLDGLLEALADSGVKHVIVEFLRETPNGLSALYARLGLPFEGSLWEPYSPSGGLLRPVASYRKAILASLRDKLAKRGISLATCKEGLFEFQESRDCCGFRFLRPDRVAYRLTLYEFWRSGWDVEKALKNAASAPELAYGPKLAAYPNPIRKILRAHENRLLKVLKRPEVLASLCPSRPECTA